MCTLLDCEVSDQEISSHRHHYVGFHLPKQQPEGGEHHSEKHAGGAGHHAHKHHHRKQHSLKPPQEKLRPGNNISRYFNNDEGLCILWQTLQ